MAMYEKIMERPERSAEQAIGAVRPAPARRKWFINGDFVMLSPTGVARQATEITRALDELLLKKTELTDDLDLTLIAPQEPIGLELKAIKVEVVPEFRKPRLPQYWSQFQLPPRAQGGLLSFCNLAPVRHPKHIACIHDMQTIHAPKSYSLPFRLAHRLILPALGRTARCITTVSELSRQHLAEASVCDPSKVVVTYSGIDHLKKLKSAPTLYGQDRPYVMCLARSEHHKNISVVWKIADSLNEIGLDVVMPGEISNEALARLGSTIPPNVRLLGRISDEQLAQCYSAAVCYLLPSQIEGFALTAVEAMVFGCPVVASVRPSMPETCGDAAIYADPDNPEAWIAAIRQIVQSDDLRETLIQKGFECSLKYSWPKIAHTHLVLMRNIDQGLPLQAGLYQQAAATGL